MVGPDGEPVDYRSLPRKKSRNPKSWVKWFEIACEIAVAGQSPLFLSCKTPRQVEMGVEIAARLLPRNYKRMPLERLYRPEDRRDAPLLTRAVPRGASARARRGFRRVRSCASVRAPGAAPPP
jgi:hypothetical protein